MKKRLHLETKIRDAAISLSKVNSSNKRLSKQTDEQLDAARRRVDTAQTEYWSISERANEVHRKLLEHRAGVLSHFVRSMEKKTGPTPSSYDSGYNSNRSTVASPTRTSTTESSNGFATHKFDGAHFFAGHVDAIVPKKILSPEVTASEISALETKLKAATEALSAAKKQQVKMTRELSLVRLEKQEVETMMGIDLQTAEDTISALEKELPRLEGLDSEVQELLKEKERWGQEKERLEEQNENLRARIAGLETRNGKADGAERLLAELRGESQRLLEEKESEIEELQTRWEAERTEWEEERHEWRQNNDDLRQLREEVAKARDENELTLQKVGQELDDGLNALQQMIREHGIVLFSRETSLKGLLEATSSHLQTVHSKLEGYGRAEADWSIAKRKLEEDVRIGLDKREFLTKELEDARRARDLANRETRALQVSHDLSMFCCLQCSSLSSSKILRARHPSRRQSPSLLTSLLAQTQTLINL
jgi:DNA repair exonuclease SbcCD ATPase subunit